MSRNVKGVLFADYVRMIRGQKSVDWRTHLLPEDLHYLDARIDPNGWYPMTSFERMGNGILAEIANGDVEAARMWGRISVDQLRSKDARLVAEGDPLETLMRFRVMRATLFDFEALAVRSAVPGHASVMIHYHMGSLAEEAASYQTMGFFERLLEVAGASSVVASFTRRSWNVDPDTRLEIHWEMPE